MPGCRHTRRLQRPFLIRVGRLSNQWIRDDCAGSVPRPKGVAADAAGAGWRRCFAHRPRAETEEPQAQVHWPKISSVVNDMRKYLQSTRTRRMK